MSQSPFVQCPDCNFISSSQGHLGIHRSKMHKCSVPVNIKSVNIVRLFPEGKSYYCCLCHNVIASFPNFKRHFSTSHNRITLNVSAKCIICDREFAKPTGAGVHIQRAHKIGKNDPYPLSPLPVRSYVDSTPMVPSLRSRSSRRISLVNSPLSGITTSPLQSSTYISDDHDTFESRHVKPASPRSTNLLSNGPDVLSPFNSQLPPPPSSFRDQSDDPEPVLIDLDPGYDDDVPPPSPPRPCPSSPSVSGNVSESLVAFAGCTDLNVEAPSFIPPTPPPPVEFYDSSRSYITS